jgi:hypothetical protein
VPARSTSPKMTTSPPFTDSAITNPTARPAHPGLSFPAATRSNRLPHPPDHGQLRITGPEPLPVQEFQPDFTFLPMTCPRLWNQRCGISSETILPAPCRNSVIPS